LQRAETSRRHSPGSHCSLEIFVLFVVVFNEFDQTFTWFLSLCRFFRLRLIDPVFVLFEFVVVLRFKNALEEPPLLLRCSSMRGGSRRRGISSISSSAALIRSGLANCG
jgi:hypothetical protein